jgi:hypothetical protein
MAAPKVASAEFIAVPKRRNFSTKYKLQILAETDRAVETGVFQPSCGGRDCIPRP